MTDFGANVDLLKVVKDMASLHSCKVTPAVIVDRMEWVSEILPALSTLESQYLSAELLNPKEYVIRRA